MREKDIKDILKSKFQLVEDRFFPDQWKTVCVYELNNKKYYEMKIAQLERKLNEITLKEKVRRLNATT